MSQHINTILPDVHLTDGHATTTSINIAKVFGKRHNDVLRDIRNLEIPEQFSLRNFALSDFRSERGKTYPMYEITRDGFTLLAMGFTGRKAMAFKLAYIEAFNQMDSRLHGNDGGEYTQHEQIQLMQAAMVQLQQQQSQILDMLKNSNRLTLAQKPDIRLNARLTAAQEQEIMELVHQGYCKTDIAKQYNISRTTVYRVLRSHTH